MCIRDRGGHYFAAGTPDPWKDKYYDADSRGTALIETAVPGFGLAGLLPVLGRTIVVHNSHGSRVGCGVIEPLFGGATATVGRYPGGGGSVQGFVAVGGATVGGLRIKGSLSGLPKDDAGQFHVHTGSTCDDADGVYGHYYPGLPSDPWIGQPTYTTNAKGAAAIDTAADPQATQAMVSFSLTGARPVASRALSLIHI